MGIVIPRLAPIPYEVTKRYETNRENQEQFKLTIRQGEDPVASKNTNLGVFFVKDIPPGPKGSQ